MTGSPGDPVAYAVAEKQLYSSHYFETALDLSFCVRGSEDAKRAGFSLIVAVASEQAGLTGIKGSVVESGSWPFTFQSSEGPGGHQDGARKVADKAVRA